MINETKQIDYENFLKTATEKGDRNFCTVCALSATTGWDYETANANAKAFGRRFKRGMYHNQSVEMVETVFQSCEKIEGWEGTTINRFASDMKYTKGNYYIFVRGHAIGFSDGEVYDWTKGRRHRIREVYKVDMPISCVPVNTPKTETPKTENAVGTKVESKGAFNQTRKIKNILKKYGITDVEVLFHKTNGKYSWMISFMSNNSINGQRTIHTANGLNKWIDVRNSIDIWKDPSNIANPDYKFQG